MPLTQSLKQRWQREQYDPSWLGLLVNPHYFARRGLRRELAPLLSELEGSVLDVGCGRKPYRSLTPRATRYVGLDLDTPASRALAAADLYYDGGDFPVGSAAFDGVICSQVLEHVFTPQRFVAELRRVLRGGGKLVLTVPFVWDEHEQPADFGRYTSFGLRALLEQNGFEVLVQKKACVGAMALVQLASSWVHKVAHCDRGWRKVAVQCGAIAPINVVGGGIATLLPRQQDLYLDNVVLARRRD